MTLRWARTRRSFDVLLEKAAASRLSFDEAALLRDTHWNLGQDARLREDVRFRPTPWGRWIVASAYLANDTLFAELHREPQLRPSLEGALAELDGVVRRPCVFCPGDPRFVLEDGLVRLSARELSAQPLVERDVGDLEKYVTHLPVHTLRAAAASLPAGEWGKRAQDQVIETKGWVRVSIGRKLSSRMFVAQIEGKSMDDGKSGLVDGRYAVFELWPTGTKQHVSVLVRGAFSDPETGSYAVKKYVADERDAEGRHNRVTLVSLNPDKERYPDINLEVEREHDVTVVAKVIQPLLPEQFSRRPRPIRRPGRRDLTSPESVAEVAAELAAHTERFFQDLPPESELEPDPSRAGWQAELVCLDGEAGGLHIEVGPLNGLWSFVKELRVEGTDWREKVLASNVRVRPVRICVPPASGPWKWQAVGHEDDSDIDLSALVLPALPPEPLAFRLDASGIGRLIASRSLAVGRRYRLLLPEPALATLARRPPSSPVGRGWQLWEVELSSTAPPEVLDILRALGFEVGDGEVALEWVLVSPIAWRTNAKGVSYPCFLAAPGPVLEVSGAEVESHGGASFLLHGPNGHSVVPLPPGEGQLVQLDDLVPGQYSALVLHDRTGIPPERVTFEVLSAALPGANARWRLSAHGRVLAPEGGGAAVLPASDLAMLDSRDAADLPGLSLAAPPGWPVRVSWRELADDLIAVIHADPDGVVDAHAVLTSTHARRTRRSMGDLVFDFAELGAAIVRHERRPTPEGVRAVLDELLASRGLTAQRLAGNYVTLLPLWIEPVCSALGYDLDLVVIDGAPDLQEHVAVHRLLRIERHGSKLERHAVRVLLLVEDLSKPLPSSLLAWVDEVCAAEALRDVIVSDGLRWADHRRASRLALRIWDLMTVTKDADAFIEFLREISEGV